MLARAVAAPEALDDRAERCGLGGQQRARQVHARLDDLGGNEDRAGVVRLGDMGLDKDGKPGPNYLTETTLCDARGHSLNKNPLH